MNLSFTIANEKHMSQIHCGDHVSGVCNLSSVLGSAGLHQRRRGSVLLQMKVFKLPTFQIPSKTHFAISKDDHFTISLRSSA